MSPVEEHDAERRVEAPARFFAQVASNAGLCSLIDEADFI